MSRRALQVFTILTLFLAAESRGQICAHGRPTNESFPFLGLTAPTDQGGFGIGAVTLYLSDAARNATFLTLDTINAGADKWTACANPSVPDFKVDPTGQRPPLSTLGTLNSSILINFIDGPAPSSGGSAEAAFWDPADNSITLYSKCPLDGTYGIPCFGNQPGGAIRWDLPGFATTVIAHEIGHALGLDHDDNDSSCTHGVMKSPLGPDDTSLGVTPTYCRLANQINNMNAPCQSEDLGAGEKNPCDSNAVSPRGGAGGPRGAGNGGEVDFCSEFSWLCGGGNPWSGSGIECNWGCVSYSDSLGGSGSSCSWGCFAAAVRVAAPKATSSTVEGLAPFVALTSPARNATIQGSVTLTGFAMDFNGIASVSFGIDGQPVAVTNYRGGLSSPEACSLPLGLVHSACRPNSGFSANLDTTLIANGSHTLSVVSYDTTGWTTSVEVPIVVNNPPPCETVPPTASITAPAGGSTVTGTVTVSASAADNVGVTGVQFYVDNSLAATDSTAPYSFNWNTTGLSAGSHTLRVRAFDACGNKGDSAVITVQVSLPCELIAPTASITAPTGGSTVTGTVSVTANAADNVGVTKVEFYVDNSLAATDTTAPYSFSWVTTGLSVGSHTLKARAYDACGNQGDSAVVTVQVPAPAYGGTHDVVNCYGAAGWAWDANSPNAPVSVSVYDGTTLLGTVVADGYRQDLKNAGIGNGYHGFSFALPDSIRNSLAHSVTIKVAGTSFTLNGSPKTITCYPLTVSPPGSSSGTVTSNPAGISCGSDCSEYYPAGTVVNLSASPAAGSMFLSWGGNADCSDGSVTMSGARACTVSFSGPAAYAGFQENLDCNLTAGWAWDANLPNTPISVSIYDGSTLLGTATADGFRQDLKNAGIGNGSHGFGFALPNSVRDGLAHSITVKPAGSSFVLGWSPKTVTCYPLTVSTTGSGTGGGTVTSNPTGISCGGDCIEYYPAGTVVTLSASPAAGSMFLSWGGHADCSDGSVTMSGARACTASFSGPMVSARVIWVQPQALAGYGPPGSLIVAGSAAGAPAGSGVTLHWRNVTANGPWVTESYAPGPDASGIWLNSIASANPNQVYAVYVTYGGTTSVTCNYAGANNITWCP